MAENPARIIPETEAVTPSILSSILILFIIPTTKNIVSAAFKKTFSEVEMCESVAMRIIAHMSWKISLKTGEKFFKSSTKPIPKPMTQHTSTIQSGELFPKNMLMIKPIITHPKNIIPPIIGFDCEANR